MSTQITLRSEAMVDPRGEFRRQPVRIAERPASLQGRTVLLFDNTQLASQEAAYGPIFKWLSEYLQAEQGARSSFDSRNLLRENREGTVSLAQTLAKSGIDAVVVALCNAGITQPTSLFAAELERLGVPCVQMCTVLGYPLAGVTAAGYVPGLPIVQAELATGAKDAFGKKETLAIAPEIVAGLTSDRATLLARSQDLFPAGELPIASKGRMLLPPTTVPASEAGGVLGVDVEPSDALLYDELAKAELSDGLPVIDPTLKRVEAKLAFTDIGPDDMLVDELPPSGSTITVRTLAANAVMAGCRPEYFPIIVAIFQAVSDPAYRLAQGAISTHPAANAVVVSGPLAEELGIQSGGGCLGPGFRANATIGRAVNLTIMNVARAIPGKSDLGIFGSPAEYTYCFAESDKNNPWEPLHTDLYDPETTSVTVHKCEAPHNVNDPRLGPEELIKSIAATAATLGGNNLGHPGHLLVMLNPGQARMLAKAGWSKQDVKSYLFETARNPQAEVLKRRGNGRFDGPQEFLAMTQVPVLRSPDDAIVVVAGDAGDAVGGFAMVGIPWGAAKAVSRPVALRDGSPLRTLKGRF